MDRLIRFEDLKERGIVKARSTLADWRKSGQFPEPIRLSGNMIAWRESVIEKWLRDRSQDAAQFEVGDEAS